MIRQPNSQSYIKVFNYVSQPKYSIPNIPQSPYYNYFKTKLLILNNKLIYGRENK